MMQESRSTGGTAALSTHPPLGWRHKLRKKQRHPTKPTATTHDHDQVCRLPPKLTNAKSILPAGKAYQRMGGDGSTGRRAMAEDDAAIPRQTRHSLAHERAQEDEGAHKKLPPPQRKPNNCATPLDSSRDAPASGHTLPPIRYRKGPSRYRQGSPRYRGECILHYGGAEQRVLETISSAAGDTERGMGAGAQRVVMGTPARMGLWQGER